MLSVPGLPSGCPVSGWQRCSSQLVWAWAAGTVSARVMRAAARVTESRVPIGSLMGGFPGLEKKCGERGREVTTSAGRKAPFKAVGRG